MSSPLSDIYIGAPRSANRIANFCRCGDCAVCRLLAMREQKRRNDQRNYRKRRPATHDRTEFARGIYGLEVEWWVKMKRANRMRLAASPPAR